MFFGAAAATFILYFLSPGQRTVFKFLFFFLVILPVFLILLRVGFIQVFAEQIWMIIVAICKVLWTILTFAFTGS